MSSTRTCRILFLKRNRFSVSETYSFFRVTKKPELVTLRRTKLDRGERTLNILGIRVGVSVSLFHFTLSGFPGGSEGVPRALGCVFIIQQSRSTYLKERKENT